MAQCLANLALIKTTIHTMQPENTKDKAPKKRKGRTWVEAARMVSEQGDLETITSLSAKPRTEGLVKNIYSRKWLLVFLSNFRPGKNPWILENPISMDILQ